MIESVPMEEIKKLGKKLGLTVPDRHLIRALNYVIDEIMKNEDGPINICVCKCVLEEKCENDLS